MWLALLAAACLSYREVPLADARSELRAGDRIRVTTVAGQLHALRVQAITGEGIRGESQEIRFEDLALVERGELDLLKSFGLYLAIATLILVRFSQDFGN